MGELELVRREYDTVLYAVACALDGTAPRAELLSAVSPERLLSLATRHSIEALLCYALERIGAATPAMQEAKNLSIRRIMLFDSARAEILSAFEKNAVTYMPLKGVILKDMYPFIGLRQMTDNDILFDIKNRPLVKKIMTELGYSVDSYQRSNQDVYMKPPIYNFELHVGLFGSGTHRRFADYFDGILDRAEIIPNTEYGRKMSTEDFYLHMKTHEHKHYAGGGTGLRSLCDTYVFWCAKGAEIDNEKLAAALDKLGIAEFDKVTTALAKSIFSPENRAAMESYLAGGEDYLTADQRKMLDFYATSGAYGILDVYVENDFVAFSEGDTTAGAKLRYVLRRIFPPVEFYKEAAPLVYKYRVLIPFYCMGRFFRAVFTKPANLIKQLRTLHKVGKDEKK